MGILSNLVGPYSWLEATAYDFMVGKAAARVVEDLVENSLRPRLRALPHGSLVTDLGCGGGHLLVALAQEFPTLEFVGVDLSPTMVRLASARAEKAGLRSPRVRFLMADVQQLCLPDESFSLVWSIGVLKHWPQPVLGVLECARILAPGGFLVLADTVQTATPERIRHFLNHSRIPAIVRPLVQHRIQRRIFAPSPTLPQLKDFILRAALELVDSDLLEQAPLGFVIGKKVGN